MQVCDNILLFVCLQFLIIKINVKVSNSLCVKRSVYISSVSPMAKTVTISFAIHEDGCASLYNVSVRLLFIGLNSLACEFFI